LFYFEELKKKPTATAFKRGKSTKTDKTDKKLMGIKRDKSGKFSSQIVPRI
jgi:hypothetical protein